MNASQMDPAVLESVKIRPERIITSKAELQECLNKISFTNSFFADLKFRFNIEPNFNHKAEETGWEIQAQFYRPDTETGQMGWGTGRSEICKKGCYEGSAVKTAWVCIDMIVRHELMEGFRYEECQIFNPHHTVPELMLPSQIRMVQNKSAHGCAATDQQVKEHAGWNTESHLEITGGEVTAVTIQQDRKNWKPSQPMTTAGSASQ